MFIKALKKHINKRTLATALCAVMILSTVVTMAPPQARADTIDNVVSQLQGIYAKMDSGDKNAINTARTNLHSLTRDRDSSPWPGVFNILLTSQVITKLGNGDSNTAKDKIIDFICGIAEIQYSTDAAALRNNLDNFRAMHSSTITALFGNDFTIDDLYNYLLAAKGQVPNVITSDINSLIAIASGNYSQIRDSEKTWLREALTRAATGQYSQFLNKLSAVGWSVDALMSAKDLVSAQVDPGSAAEIALTKAYVRSETHFLINGQQNDSAITLNPGDTLPLKLAILGYDFAGDVLDWDTDRHNIATVNNKILTAVAAGDTTLTAFKPGNAGEWVYQVNVHVNATLSGLTISAGRLDPAFAPSTTQYTAVVGSEVSGITVTPTTADANAMVKVNGTAVQSGTASGTISLNSGSSRIITVTVTAQSGASQNYTLTVFRPQAVAATPSNPTVTVTAGTPVAITISQDVSAPKIQATVNPSNNQATLPLVQVQAVTSLGTVAVQIPDSTTVTGPAGWDGKIELPTVKANSSVTVSSGTVNAVVEVGLPDEILTFDKAVRLLIPGMAGKSAAYRRGNGDPVTITRIISADSQTVANTELQAGQEGKIDVGSDLVIWTKHFTEFIAYTPSGGGGGGGGGTSTTPAATAISDSDLNAAINAAGSGGKISIQASSDNKIGFTIAQLDKVAATGKQIEVKAADVTFTFDAGALKAPDLNFTNVSVVQIGATKLGSDAAKEITGKATNGGLYDVAGDIFSLSALAAMNDKTQQDIKKFNGTVKVTLPAPEAARDAASKGNLKVGRFNEETSAWDLVSGSYDGISGTFTFETDKFSKWALLTPKPLVFSDIAGHWAQKDIEFMAANGYVNGMGDGTFAPDTAVTRAQFATLLVKLLKLKDEGTIPFLDVPKDAWYYGFVARASAAGLIKGYNDEQFGPEDSITREQTAAMIARALQYKGKLKDAGDTGALLGRFADKDLISGWAATPVAQIVSQEIIKGRPGASGTLLFAPQDNATRAEATSMLKRLLSLL